MQKVLIANRGEIAIRVARAAAEAGLTSVAVCAADDTDSLHARAADTMLVLEGSGPSAYLHVEAIIGAAHDSGADCIHPGYGFLSENPALARAARQAGLLFIGPPPEALDMFGDKLKARALARSCGVPVVAGSNGPVDLDGARQFMTSLGAGASVMIKAVAGGGGRGMRPVSDIHDLAAVMERCRSEAETAFGDGALYIERLVPEARHIEVQVAADNDEQVIILGDRDCSLQRQRQKIVEVAPAPGLTDGQRRVLSDHARILAQTAGYRGLGTVEFLLEADGSLAFMEFNARLQVEHTVTEAVTGLDLVLLQFDIARGRSVKDLEVKRPHGHAIQARVNLETMRADGTVRPSGGILTGFEPPAGPGIRVDHFGYTGYRTSPLYDSLLAKVVVHSTAGNLAAVVRKTERALSEFRLDGVASNLAFLRSLLSAPEWTAFGFDTGYIERNAARLVAMAENVPMRWSQPAPAATPTAPSTARLAGARIDDADPLAVLDHGRRASDTGTGRVTVDTGSEGHVIRAPMPGAVLKIEVEPGAEIWRGRVLLIMESMKMEHEIAADVSGILRRIVVAAGDNVFEDSPLMIIEGAEIAADATETGDTIDPDHIRPDLAEVETRRALGFDANRPEAVARRQKTGQRTARANVEDLVDPGTFIEYGPMVIAARRARTPFEELIRRTPADGMIGGIGQVNSALLPDADTRCMVMSYDYAVLAGTQGKKNHQKKDRLFRLAEQWRLPVIFFAEGGGGRPGDTDVPFAANLHTPAFHLFGKLSGNAPMIGIASGRCFAGNAVILGCCDVTIATANATIGMGGPAMIEGGGLGVFTPEEVGPVDVMRRNGVVDIAVADEIEAVNVAKRYLSYFQGCLEEWNAADQRLLRHVVPENRLRVYDVMRAIELIADTGSVLELRRDFGIGMITALARIEGRPVGILANNPRHIGGAIDSEAADKAARFMQLCDAYDLPIVSLCDTPGNMVGPEAERTALVRHCCRLYVIGANVTVPIFTVVLRKAYGLGAQAMAGGGFHAPFFAVSWPTGEYGGMGLEGSVKLGFRDQLAAIDDLDARREAYEQLVAEAYERGKALNTATLFEIDDVIDPADTRRWIVSGLSAIPPAAARTGKKLPWIDTW